MENHHHSAFWPLNKHFQRPFDEPVFGLHAVHAVAEQDDVEFFVAITRTGAGTAPCVAVQNEWDSMDVGRAFQTGQRGLRLRGRAKPFFQPCSKQAVRLKCSVSPDLPSQTAGQISKYAL